MRNSRDKAKIVSLFAGFIILITGIVLVTKVAGSNNSKSSVSVNVEAAGATDGSNSGVVAGENKELATGTGNVTFETEPESDIGYGAVVGSTGISSEKETIATQAPTQEETQETTESNTVATTTTITETTTSASVYTPTQSQTEPATQPELKTEVPAVETQAATEAPVVEEQTTEGAKRSEDEYHNMAVANTSVYSEYIQQVYELINKERAEAGQSSVYLDNTLTVMACHRAVENADNDFFVVSGGHHRRPVKNADGSYKEAKTICYYYGQYGSFGEVMGRYQSTPQGIVLGWHNSQAHYDCMVNSVYTRVGVGVAKDSSGRYYWVAIFMN